MTPKTTIDEPDRRAEDGARGDQDDDAGQRLMSDVTQTDGGLEPALVVAGDEARR